MTHPPAGPSTPPPPSGPRFQPFNPDSDAHLRKLAAELAGARGWSPHPLGDVERIDRYWRQNGHTKGLTPRQRRRAEHKACRNFYRLSLTA